MGLHMGSLFIPILTDEEETQSQRGEVTCHLGKVSELVNGRPGP